MLSEQRGPRFVVPAQGGRVRPRRPAEPDETAGSVGSFGLVGSVGSSWREIADRSGAADRDQAGCPEAAGPALGETWFRALFEAAPVGVALSAPDGRFVHVTHALRELLLDVGVVTATDTGLGHLTDLVRHLPPGADECRAWQVDLADIRDGRSPVTWAELAVSPPGTPPRWVRVTSALVEFGGLAYLLSRVEETTGERLAARHQDPFDRCVLLGGGVAARDVLEERLVVARTRAATSGLSVAILVVGPDPAGPPSLSDGLDDEVVDAVGGALRTVLRAADTVARLGAGTLAVVAPDVPDEAALDRLIGRLEAAFVHPARSGRSGTPLMVGVGGTLIGPAETGAAALRRATEALAAAWRERPSAERVDLRETDRRDTDLRGADPGHGGTDGEAPLAEHQL